MCLEILPNPRREPGHSYDESNQDTEIESTASSSRVATEAFASFSATSYFAPQVKGRAFSRGSSTFFHEAPSSRGRLPINPTFIYFETRDVNGRFDGSAIKSLEISDVR